MFKAIVEIIKKIFIYIYKKIKSLATFLKKLVTLIFMVILHHRLHISLLVIVVFVFFANLYCTTRGLPSSLHSYIIKKINVNTDVEVDARRIKVGLFQGVTFDDLRIYWPKSKKMMARFEEVQCRSLSFLYRNAEKKHFEVKVVDGSLFLPWGKKIFCDKININLNYIGEKNCLIVNKMGASVIGLPALFEGKVIFPIQNNIVDANTLPQEPSFISAPRNPIEIVEDYLYEIKDDVEKLDAFLKKSLMQKDHAIIEAEFEVDFEKKTNSASGRISLPSMTHGGFHFRKIRSSFALNGNILELKNIDLLVNNRDFIDAEVYADLSTNEIKIQGKGAVDFKTLALLMPEYTTEFGKINFLEQIHLESFSLEISKPKEEDSSYWSWLKKGEATILANNIIKEKLSIQSVVGNLNLENGKLSNSYIWVRLNTAEEVKIKSNYSLVDQSGDIEVEGAVSLATILTQAKKGLISERFIALNDQNMLFHVDGLIKLPKDKTQWSINGNVVAPSIVACNLPKMKLSLNVNACEKYLKVRGLQLSSIDQGALNVQGSVNYDINQDELSGELKFYGDGSIFPENSLVGLGKFNANIVINPSKFIIDKLNGSMDFEIDLINNATKEARPMTGIVDFGVNNVVLKHAEIDVASKILPNAKLIISGDCQLETKTTGAGRINFFLDLKENKRLKEEAYKFGADYKVDDENLSFVFDVDVYGDQIYDALYAIGIIPENDIGCRVRLLGNETARAKGKMEVPIADFKNWQLFANLEIENGSYIDWEIKEASSDFYVNQYFFEFSKIKGITAKNEVIENLNIKLDFYPIILTINGKGLLNPALAEVFIDYDCAKDIYKKIWEYFDFKKEEPPIVNLEHLRLQENSKEEFDLFIRGNMAASNLSCSGVKLQNASMKIELDLGTSLRIYDIEAVAEDGGKITGSVSIEGEMPVLIQFDLKSEDLNPQSILSALKMDYTDFAGKMKFSGKHSHACQGTVALQTIPIVNLKGSSNAESVTVNNITATNVSGNWAINDTDEIFWDVQKANLWGGEFNSTGSYRLNTRSGKTAIRFYKLNLTEFFYALNKDENKAALSLSKEEILERGQISGDFRVELLKEWANVPLQFAGNGQCRITAKNVWNVPIFTSLAKAIDQNSLLGRITQVDTNLVFNGQQIGLDFKTDGTIVALNGRGYYHLKEDQIMMRISADTLKDIRLFSLFSRPVSWLFEVELKGTPRNYRWHFLRGIRGWFKKSTLESIPNTYEDYWK